MLGRFGFYKYSDLIPCWDKNELHSIMSSDPAAPKKLQNELKKLSGSKYVILTNYGRTALYLGFKALGLKQGAKVAVPSLMCGSPVDSIIKSGLKPIFIDVNDDLSINVKSLELAIKMGVQAVLIPSLAGNLRNYGVVLDVAKKNKLIIIDDAAQSFGAKYKTKLSGTFGDFGVLSFNIGKNLYACGGGVFLTNKKQLFDNAIKYIKKESKSKVFVRTFEQMLKTKFRKYTRPIFYFIEKCSRNRVFPVSAKMPIMVAALALDQIKKAKVIIKKRQENAKQLSSLLEGLPLRPIFDKNSIYTKYLIELSAGRVPSFRKFLRIRGIETETFYKPLHLNDKYSIYEKCNLSNSERIWSNLCVLPVSPDFNRRDIEYLAKQINLFFK